jgi:RHS repeat-associated protein
LSRSEDGTTTDYTYPAGGPGSVRPHAATQVAGDSYVWDTNGNLSQRTVDGVSETLAWSAERLLESVTGPAGTTSFTYGPDGGRLLRTAPGGARTLYLVGHEVTASPDGTTVAATRTYSFGGQMIATRTSDGVDYLLADQQGSIQIAIESGATSPTGARSYLPYGGARSGDGDGFASDRAWIGQIEDTTTNLSYLNARYYDSASALFISPDPVYDARPLTLNPYSYSMNNPATLSDPSGLDPPWFHDNDSRNDPPLYFQLSYGNTKNR